MRLTRSAFFFAHSFEVLKTSKDFVATILLLTNTR